MTKTCHPSKVRAVRCTRIARLDRVLFAQQFWLARDLFCARVGEHANGTDSQLQELIPSPYAIFGGCSRDVWPQRDQRCELAQTLMPLHGFDRVERDSRKPIEQQNAARFRPSDDVPSCHRRSLSGHHQSIVDNRHECMARRSMSVCITAPLHVFRRFSERYSRKRIAESTIRRLLLPGKPFRPVQACTRQHILWE